MHQRQRLWAAAILFIGVLIVALFALAGILQRNGGAPQGAAPSETPGRGLAVVVSPDATQTRRPEASPGLMVEPTVEQAPTQAPGSEETEVNGAPPSGGVPPYPSRRATAPETPTATTGVAGGETRAATATMRATPRPLATATDAGGALETAAPTSRPSSTTAKPTPNPTATPRPGATATPGAADTPAPQQTLPSNPTATPGPPGISGRVLIDGQVAEPGLVLLLEDPSFTVVAETTVGDGGRYRFEDAPASDDGYNVTFNWERNQAYDLSEVIAWGWIGPVPYDGESDVQLPDLEIELSGLAQVEPEPDTSHAASTLSPATPLTFVWGAHPAATRYWVDLLADESFARVWHSTFTESTSTTFDGQLDDGTGVAPGVYWWAVGGQSTVQGYQVTVYGHLAGLTIRP